jgi:anti-anti-sigma regulatory factor
VLDPERLDFIDSIGVRNLLAAADCLEHRLYIVAPADAPLLRTLDVLGLSSRFITPRSRRA